jgi:phosphoenolpyruvate phosphomutase / 2-hydroxyethylphosphonate cytidylyltransferase
MRIYAPMTCDILVVGHIRFLKKLSQKGQVIVGVLTDQALKGYKKNCIPFKDRYEILNELWLHDELVPQTSLDPTANLIKYQCDAIASGDGFEPSEQAAAKRLGVKLLNIKSGSKLHSSHLKCN